MNPDDEWQSAVAYLKAFSVMYAENRTRTFKVMRENEKWIDEQLRKLGKMVAEVEGTEKSNGEKEATIGLVYIKLKEDGSLKYIKYGGDYVISSFGKDGAIIDKVEALGIIYEHLWKSVEMTNKIEELKGNLTTAVEEYEKQVLPNAKSNREELDRLAKSMGKFLVDSFGYCKGNNCYYIVDVNENGKTKTLEIKIERGSMKYIRLGNNYIVSQYGYSQVEEYMRLINVLQKQIDVKIEDFKEQKKEMNVNLPDGIDEKIKSHRKLLTERVKELATKLAIWYGTGDSNNNYTFNGEINYSGKTESLKIKVERGELKYVQIGDRYIYSSWGDKPYLSWLFNAHQSLYGELMRRINGIEVKMEEAGAYERIPVEAEVKVEPDPSAIGDFDIEEGRILLPEVKKKGDTITRTIVAWKDGRMEVWDNYRMKEVKTRTPHVCEACGREIGKGEKALVITERTKHGKRFSRYYCSDEYEIKEQEIKVSAEAVEPKNKRQPQISL